MRKRPNADNTQRSSPPKNVYWEMTRAGEPCRYCGRLHDSAGRQLDENGKLMVQTARQDGDVKSVKVCPLAQKQQIGVSRGVTTPKANRMLGTERERLSRIGK
jgi:hypothetical protein